MNNLNSTISSLVELNIKIATLKAEAELLESQIKAEMVERAVDQICEGGHIVRYTDVVSSRFDTKAFKEKMGIELYKAFSKEVSSKRFSIS